MGGQQGGGSRGSCEEVFGGGYSRGGARGGRKRSGDEGVGLAGGMVRVGICLEEGVRVEGIGTKLEVGGLQR